MKIKTTIVLMFLLVLMGFWIAPNSRAATSISLQYQHVIYDNPELSTAMGLVLEIEPELFSPFYFNLSLDHSTLFLGGQEAADLALIGAGIGVKIPQRFFDFSFGIRLSFCPLG